MNPAPATRTEDLSGGRIRLAPAGPLDKTAYADLTALATSCLAREGVTGLYFDLSGLTALTAAGAGVFLGLAPEAAARGVTLALYGLPASLAAKAELYGLPSLVSLFPDAASAGAE